jgi:hypothetical protein
MYENDISRLIKKWTVKTGLCIESNDFDKKLFPTTSEAGLLFNWKQVAAIIMLLIRSGEISQVIQEVITAINSRILNIFVKNI